jgi:hypothetical protein
VNSLLRIISNLVLKVLYSKRWERRSVEKVANVKYWSRTEAIELNMYLFKRAVFVYEHKS